MPGSRTYDKTDFTLLYEDGFEYKGRYDLKHYMVEEPSLFEHVRNHILFNAGHFKPAWMTDLEYKAQLASVDCQPYEDFAKDYIGLNLERSQK